MEVTSVPSFLDYWKKVRGRTRRVADCIPDERLEWTWKAGDPTTRGRTSAVGNAGTPRVYFTLGDLVRHLAGIERYMYAENVQGLPSRYAGHGRELADGPAAVREFLERCHAESLAIFAGLTDERLREKCETPAGASISVGKWLRLMIEHEIHHRGQLYMALGILGVETPPIYGLTSEQVRSRSIPDRP